MAFWLPFFYFCEFMNILNLYQKTYSFLLIYKSSFLTTTDTTFIFEKSHFSALIISTRYKGF